VQPGSWAPGHDQRRGGDRTELAAHIVGLQRRGGRDISLVVDQREVREDEVAGGDVLAEESGGEPPISGVIDEALGAVGADFADAFVPGFRSAELLGRRTGDESGECFGMVERQGQTDAPEIETPQ
jgi:hypothetical protein